MTAIIGGAHTDVAPITHDRLTTVVEAFTGFINHIVETGVEDDPSSDIYIYASLEPKTVQQYDAVVEHCRAQGIDVTIVDDWRVLGTKDGAPLIGLKQVAQLGSGSVMVRRPQERYDGPAHAA